MTVGSLRAAAGVRQAEQRRAPVQLAPSFIKRFGASTHLAALKAISAHEAELGALPQGSSVRLEGSGDGGGWDEPSTLAMYLAVRIPVTGDVHQFGRSDTVLCHASDPSALLRRAAPLLAKVGALLANPNVMAHSSFTSRFSLPDAAELEDVVDASKDAIASWPPGTRLEFGGGGDAGGWDEPSTLQAYAVVKLQTRGGERVKFGANDWDLRKARGESMADWGRRVIEYVTLFAPAVA